MPIQLNLQNYLWIQGVLLFLGVLFLLWRPRKKTGLSLRFENSKENNPAESGGNLVQFQGKKDRSRSLQVFFNYNGHTFEAYETLGLPAGASIKTVEEAFQKQKVLADSESRPFLEAAHSALNSSLKSAKN